MTDDSQREPTPDPARQALNVLVGLVVLGGLAYALYAAFVPAYVPQKVNPGYLDNIFDNRWVIAAARLVLLSVAVALIFAAAYVVASIVARMGQRQWLRRAGGFEADLAEAERAIEQAQELLDQVGQAWEEREDLESRLAERTDQLEVVIHERDALAAKVQELEAALAESRDREQRARARLADG